MRALLALEQLQGLLQSIHGIQVAPVGEFLVDRGVRDRLAPDASPREALLVSERGEELHVGLFLDPGVLGQLDKGAAEPWTHERLQAFCAAAEGVSHFLYLHWCVQRHRRVSQLELETQGELDKYLAVLLQLWAVGRRAASPLLRKRLYEQVSFRSGLSVDERERYVLASALAAACAKGLETRYVLAGRLDALLREVRRLFRLSGGEKFSALARGAVAWAA